MVSRRALLRRAAASINECIGSGTSATFRRSFLEGLIIYLFLFQANISTSKIIFPSKHMIIFQFNQ